METTYSSKTSVDLQRTTQRYIPKDRNLQDHSFENLKSNIKTVFKETGC
jgi:hypothetical protein